VKILLKILWWVTIVLPIIAFIRWGFATWFLLLHRLFRSSAGVRKKQKAAYDTFFQERQNVMESHSNNVYYLMMPVLDKQSSRYISIETVRAVQALYLIDNQTVVDLLDYDTYHFIDKKGIEEELDTVFSSHHIDNERDARAEKLVAKTYGKGGEDAPVPGPQTIAELLKHQMEADATCSPMVETSPCNWAKG
jgi:hypothetical protein